VSRTNPPRRAFPRTPSIDADLMIGTLTVDSWQASALKTLCGSAPSREWAAFVQLTGDSFNLPTLPVAYGPDRETKTTAPAVNAFDLEGLMEAFAGDALVNDQLREFSNRSEGAL
jgi:hypothetical protein